ncbi:MAG: nitroreductase family protein [Thermomicrobiales bacterium]|nr:nitroreductase family protein [Thermomicrobiales bacterium]
MSVAESTYPEPSLDVICRNGALTHTSSQPVPREAHALQGIFQNRRSIRRLHDGPFSPEMQQRVLEAVRLTPAAYNLPPWRVILVHEQRDDVWQQIESAFRDHLSGDRLERNLGRLTGFRSGVALAFIYEDLRVGRTLRAEKGASDELATQFVQQALGMVQLALWLALTAEGLSSSLQHWEEFLGDRTEQLTGLPAADFRLAAAMPIGYAAEEPRAIERPPTAQVCAVDPGAHGPARPEVV